MKRVTLIMLSLLILGGVYAQSDTLQMSDFGVYVKKAIDNSYSVSNSKMDVSKTQIERQIVRNVFLPKVSVSGEYAFAKTYLKADYSIPNVLTMLPYDGDYHTNYHLDGAHIFDAGVSATWVLFTGLKATYGMKALQHKANAQSEMVKVEESKVIKETVLFFDRLAVVRQAEKVLELSSKRLDEERKAAEKALSEGLITSFDVRKIKIASLQLESKRIELRGQKSIILIRLSQLTGLDKETINSTKLDFNEWQYASNGLTAESRPEIAALQEKVTATKYKLKSTYSGYLPKVVALGTHRYSKITENRTGGISAEMYPTNIVGVGLQWEIFDGFHTHHESKKAKLELLQTNNDLDNAKELLNVYYSKAYVDYNVAKEQVAVKEEISKESAHYLKISIKEYREGLIKISERLEAETDVQKSELEYLQAVLDQRQKTLDLMEATGQLNIERFNELVK